MPQVAGDTQAQAGSSRWWVLLAVVVGLVLLGWVAAMLWGRRQRRQVSHVEPDGEDVPLRFEGVTKAYKDGFVAVRDLSFEVRRGQVLGLLGPNGAGKTTSLRMLMGLIRPTEGRISIFGHAARPGAPVLSRLGSFVEGTGLQPHLSGRDNLRLYWAATGRPVEDAHMDDAIAVAGLGTAIDRPVRRYSQGMRQRVAIAQAMLGLPDLLVLDEPTNGLDPPQIHAMREVLRSYAATGRTVIVSSHLLSEIEQTCSHVVVMAKGQKIAQGTVEEIVGTGGAVSIGLVDDTQARPRRSRSSKACPGVTTERTDEGLVADLDGTSRARALQALVEAGHRDRPVHAASSPRRRLPGPGGGVMTTESAAKMAFAAPRDTEHVQATGAVGWLPARAHAAAVGGAAPAVQAASHHRRLRAHGRAPAGDHRGAPARAPARRRSRTAGSTWSTSPPRAG